MRGLLRSRFGWAVIVVLATLTACGGGAVSPEAQAVRDVAEQNQGSLNLTGDLATNELLDGGSGEIMTLSDVVTGDRPVLVWYWAPD